MGDRLDCLDKGYVELVDVFGSELSIANAARGSFLKRSITFDEKDAKLVRFLAREDHGSPFRHAFVQFEVKAPLMVARQWWKYVVGSDHTMDAWNEASRRYVTMEPEFYVPNENQWRSSPENKKQGSGAAVDSNIGHFATERLEAAIYLGMEYYNWSMEHGICAEQSRLHLPAYAMYTNWWWTASVQSVMHFLDQRLAEDAQVEIQTYAQAVAALVRPHFSNAFDVLVVDDDDHA